MTARVTDDERHRAILGRLPGIVFDYSLSGASADDYVSPRVQDILGYSPNEVLKGRENWLDRVHPEDRPALVAAFASANLPAKQLRVAFRIRTRRDAYVPIEVEAVISDNRLSGIALPGGNLNLQMLEHQDRIAAVRDLAGRLGHALGNPLAAIRNSAFYLARRFHSGDLPPNDARIDQFLALIEHELGNCRNIVRDLLDYGQLRTFYAAACPLRPLVDEAVSSFSAITNVRVTNDVPEILPIPSLDHDQFLRAIVNLLKNAVDAIPEGRAGDIHVSGKAEGGRLLLEISDNGVGIPKEALESVFLPFVTTKASATGIGLPIVSLIVARHGGTMQIESAVQKGSRVTIAIPYHES